MIIVSNDAQERIDLSSSLLEIKDTSKIKTFNVKGKLIFSAKGLDLIRSDYLKNLNTRFLSEISLNSSAVAYRKEKSYLDFFEPHTSSYRFLRLDIKSFFHSISEELVRDVFSSYFSDELFFDNENNKQSLLDAFINLTFIKVDENFSDLLLRGKKILPIGFETSPSISNIIFRKFDILIQDFCSRNNISYTRYADDMLFSSSKKILILVHSKRFIDEISYYNF